jgi:hypothetical protein
MIVEAVIDTPTQRLKPMTLAIETHKLTRFFDGFCAVKGIELAVELGTFYGLLPFFR